MSSDTSSEFDASREFFGAQPALTDSEVRLRRWGWRLMPDGLWLDSQGKYRLTPQAALARVERDEARGDQPEADLAREEDANGGP